MSQFAIFPLPPNLNQIINSNRHSKYSGAKLKKQWTEHIAILAQQQLQPFVFPVEIHFEFHLKDKRTDPDNILCGSLKIINDAFVHSQLLPDDSFKFFNNSCPFSFSFIWDNPNESFVKVIIN